VSGFLAHAMNPYAAVVQRARLALRHVRLKPFDSSTLEGRSSERYRLIALSGGAAVLGRFAVAFVGLATVPMLLNHLGKDLFGIWAIVSSLVVWMQLFDFGIGNGLANALAEAVGRGDRQSASRYLSSAVTAIAAISLLGLPALVAAVLAIPWDRVLRIDAAKGALLADALLVVGVVFLLNLTVSLVTRVFTAHQRGYLVSLFQAGAAVVSLVLLVLALHLQMHFLWFVGILAATPLLANIALWFALDRAAPGLRVRPGLTSQPALRRVAHSSVPLFAFQCGALLVNELVNIVIARTASLSMVTDYNVVQRVYLFVFAIAAGLSAPFYPAIREAFEKGERKWVSRAVRNALLMRLATLLPCALILLIAGDALLRLWIGPAAAPRIGTLGWAAVGMSLLLGATSSLLGEALSSLDDIWSQFRVVMLSALTVLVCMTILVPRIGVPGVYVAMALSTLYAIAWSIRRLRSTLHGCAPRLAQ
jgi:O-antigen/teichoic acid export membrane protein